MHAVLQHLLAHAEFATDLRWPVSCQSSYKNFVSLGISSPLILLHNQDFHVEMIGFDISFSCF